jgi:2-polyprenyl-3-methyl-5-hydroxy-6-metoxy-1,4-benzoquinol methylase
VSAQRPEEDVMGSGQVQGPLWGAKAQDWSELTEPGQAPFYEAVFDALDVGPATRLLDVGCGAGLAMQLAASAQCTSSTTSAQPRRATCGSSRSSASPSRGPAAASR